MKYALAFLLCLLSSPASAADTPSSPSTLLEAFTFYAHGNFEAAAEKYRDILNVDTNNGEAYAGLVRTLLKQKKIDEAQATLDKALQTADSPQVRVVAGEVEFREGLVSDAEMEWVKVINSGHPEGRAYLGLARVSNALSLYKREQTMLQKAHAAAPDDPDIRRAWMSTLKRADRIKYLEDYLANGDAEDAETRAHLQHYLDYLKARAQGPPSVCRLVSKVTSAEAPLAYLLRDANHLRGYGLEVNFGDTKSKLLLDTGAGGIVVDRKVAEKAGLKQISATTVGGIGSKAEANGYVALAPSIRVGGLEFQDCPVEVIDRKSIVEEDGLIGADVFGKFLVNLDFAHQKLRLSELPKRPGQTSTALSLNSESDDSSGAVASQQSPDSKESSGTQDNGPFDHYIAPEMKNYTQVLRFGHMILVPTWINDDKVAKFFLLDSGGFTTQLSLNAAKTVTKVHVDPNMHIRGIQGEVNKVYVADKATLTFARLRQETQDAIVFDLKPQSDHVGTEISGVIGFTTLRFLNMNIDYRDGLIFLQYQGPPVR